jgi:hypothetical protein
LIILQISCLSFVIPNSLGIPFTTKTPFKFSLPGGSGFEHYTEKLIKLGGNNNIEIALR